MQIYKLLSRNTTAGLEVNREDLLEIENLILGFIILIQGPGGDLQVVTKR